MIRESRLSIGQCAQLACVLEATARKPGNVTRFTDFRDLTYLDFVLAAAAIAPVMERAGEHGIGSTVRDAVLATRRFVGTNVNLGMILLLAPLSAVPIEVELQRGIGDVLRQSTLDDSRLVFEAIRLANPGGLGQASQQDVRADPSLPLREVMALASARDSIARQYATDFADVFTLGVPALMATPLESAIIHCHLMFLSAFPDSHIARRCGSAMAIEAQRRAAEALAGRESIESFDAWLRADGQRRNPGTSADLVAASLFVALRRGMIDFPVNF